MALSVMISWQSQNVKNAYNSSIDDKFLQYVYVHILSPEGLNYAQLLHENISILWGSKSNIHINRTRNYTTRKKIQD